MFKGGMKGYKNNEFVSEDDWMKFLGNGGVSCVIKQMIIVVKLNGRIESPT